MTTKISTAENPTRLSFEARVRRLLLHCKFPPYQFVLYGFSGPVYLQAKYDDPDIYTGVMKPQHTRKWLLSPHMTDSEIVLTAFKCVLTSMEHRTRERFTYKGARIFGPHFDVEDMVRLCKDGREDAGGRDPRNPTKECP